MWAGRGRPRPPAPGKRFSARAPRPTRSSWRWNYARYIDAVTEAGKAEYALPMFVNAWIVQPEDKGPGDYPSGGPQTTCTTSGAPARRRSTCSVPTSTCPISPASWPATARSGNPIFVPESAGDTRGAANAFYAIGQHRAIGYSPFGIDDIARLMASGPDAPAARRSAAPDVEALPFSVGLQDARAVGARPSWSTSQRGPSPPRRSNRQNPDQQIQARRLHPERGLAAQSPHADRGA